MGFIMPCYLFTYHGYKTWLPDREEGFVEHHRQHNEPDLPLAIAYEMRSNEEVVLFDGRVQKSIIDAVTEAQPHQALRLHFVATESTHAHVLVSWKDDERPWIKLRSGIKSSITRKLNASFERRTWLNEGASRRKVGNQEHYDYLVVTYLPSHRGWKWSEDQGLFR